jgi:DNA-3-methyladenine glycosylase II
MVLHIVGQQISTAAARTIYDRILTAAGGERLTASALSALGVERLRGAGLSHAKAVAVAELAHGQLQGGIDLEHMDQMTDAREVEARGAAWSPYRTYAAALLWTSLRE